MWYWGVFGNEIRLGGLLFFISFLKVCGEPFAQGSIILLLPPPLPLPSGKKSKIRNQGREFKTYKETEG